MGLHAILWALASVSTVWSYTVNDCPASLSRDNYLRVYGNYCYTYVPHQRDFPTAETECKSRGGHLVVIRDADTQQFLYNASRQVWHVTTGVIWIGMTDVQREGEHHWVDGSAVTYTNWAPGEPNGDPDDCSVMDLSRRGEWADYMCTGSTFVPHRHTFICENSIPASGVSSTPQTVTLAGDQYSINDCPSSLPPNSHLYVHGSSCYDFVGSQSKEFNAAELECEQRNGHLVTIKDAATQQFIYRTFTRDLRYHGVVWIGMTDQHSEGYHVWVDGSPVSYTHWASGEPTGDAFDCAIMELNEGGAWYDYLCADRSSFFGSSTEQHYFVCEYRLSGAPVSTPLPATVSSYTVADCPPHTPLNGHLHVYGGSCYDFVNSHGLEFQDAERECAASHGHLVTIHDAGTQSFVYRTFLRDFPRFRGVIWIGLTDRQYEGTHVWTDGSPVTYTNWAVGEPTGSNDDCAIMNLGQGGAWYDYPCIDTFPIFGSDAEHYFVCEYRIVNTTTPAVTKATVSSSQPSTTVPDTTPETGTTSPPSTATTPTLTTPPGPTTSTPQPTTTTPEPTTATPEPTTATPEPTSTTEAAEPYTASTPEPTPSPEETTPDPETTVAHVTVPPTCPPFQCGLDCGLSGYILDAQGCMLCECET